MEPELNLQQDVGAFYKWSYSNIVRIPARLIRLPGFPFKQGEKVMVTLDARNKMLVITPIRKISKPVVRDSR